MAAVNYNLSLNEFIQQYPNSLPLLLNENGQSKHLNLKLRKELVALTSWMNSDATIIDRIYCYVNNITEYPVCSICGKPICHVRTFNKGFPKNCCRDNAKYVASMQKYYNDKEFCKERGKKSKEALDAKYTKEELSNMSKKTRQKQLDDYAEKYNSITEYYNKEELYQLLNGDLYHYSKYMGSTACQRLKRDNLKLYKSIFIHTDEFKPYFKKDTFTVRMLIIAKLNYDISKNLCYCGSKLLFNPETQEIEDHKFCKKCNLRKEFLFKHWAYLMNLPEEEAYQAYVRAVSEKRIATAIENNTSAGFNLYSKVSQKLFEAIYNNLKNKDNVFYATLNDEYRYYLTPEESRYFAEKTNPNGKIYFSVDFIQNNNIIEFDGDYWHRQLNRQYADGIRDSILQSHGFNILRIAEMDFYKDPISVINKCLNYLEGKDYGNA